VAGKRKKPWAREEGDQRALLRERWRYVAGPLAAAAVEDD
jgi:hypothetical protein